MRALTRACLVIIAVGVTSMTPMPGWTDEPMSKRQLVLELLDLSGGGSMSQRFSEVILSSMRANYPAMVDRILASQRSLSDADKETVRERLADRDRFFNNFSTRLSERIDLDRTLADIHAPLYEEHFSEDELRQMLAFQSSPVGRKATAIMPQLLQQGTEATMQRLQPIVSEMTMQLFAEEQALALGK